MIGKKDALLVSLISVAGPPVHDNRENYDKPAAKGGI